MDISLYPRATGDEQELLSTDFRLSFFGQRNDPVTISEAYNQSVSPKLPFPWTGLLRSIFHLTAGWSPYSGRVFSALSILFCILVAGILLPLKEKFEKKELLFIFLITATSPPLYFAARTIRLEQEILLSGILSLFMLPLLTGKNRKKSYNLFLWFFSGLFSSWAGISHPGGLIFPGVAFLSLLLLKRELENQDGLHFRTRLFAWCAGALIPIIFALSIVIGDYGAWKIFMSDMALRFQEVSKRLTAYWAPLWPFSFPTRPVLRATLYSYGLSAVTPWLEYPFSSFLTLLFFIQSFFILAYGFFSMTFARLKSIHSFQLTCLACGFILMHFAYSFLLSPNYTFYPYLGLFIPLTFTFFSLKLSRIALHRTERQLLSRIFSPYNIPLLISFLTLISYLHFSFFQIFHISELKDRNRLISLDSELMAVSYMAGKLGWHSNEQPTYADNLTWCAAGRKSMSLFEALLSSRITGINQNARMAYELTLFSSLLSYPGFGNRQLRTEEIELRLKKLHENRRLSGVLLTPSTGYLFFDLQEEKNASGITSPAITLAILERNEGPVKLSRTRTDRIFPLKILGSGRLETEALPENHYLLLLKGASLAGRSFVVTVKNESPGSSQTTEPSPNKETGCRKLTLTGLRIQKYAPFPVLLEVPHNGKISLELMDTTSSYPEDIEASLSPLDSWQSIPVSCEFFRL